MLDEETPNTPNGTDGLNSELEASSAVAKLLKDFEKGHDGGKKNIRVRSSFARSFRRS